MEGKIVCSLLDNNARNGNRQRSIVRAPWIPFDPTMNPQLLREVFSSSCVVPLICKIYSQCDDGPRIAHSPIKMVSAKKSKSS